MKSLISIIIPIYNGSKTIKKCVESILNQTYEKIELILVNDGSTDETETILKKICDNRIKYYYIENSGVSFARNYGIAHSNGDFIFFVDCDDYIESNCIQTLYNYVINNDLDIVKANYYINMKKNSLYNKKNKVYNMNDMHDYEEINKVFFNTYILNPVWGELIRKSVIKSRFDLDIKMGEDFKFNFETFKNANKIMIVDEYVYYYSLNEMGINYNKTKEKVVIKINSILTLYEKMFFEEDDKDIVVVRAIKELFPHIIELFSFKDIDEILDNIYSKKFIIYYVENYKKINIKKYKYKVMLSIFAKKNKKILKIYSKLILFLKRIWEKI